MLCVCMIGIFYRDFLPIPLQRPCKCVWFFTGFERWLVYSFDVGIESKTAFSQKNLSVVISLCLIRCPSEEFGACCVIWFDFRFVVDIPVNPLPQVIPKNGLV